MKYKKYKHVSRSRNTRRNCARISRSNGNKSVLNALKVAEYIKREREGGKCKLQYIHYILMSLLATVASRSALVFIQFYESCDMQSMLQLAIIC